MIIQFYEVTWYSKLGMIIVFALVMPVLAFIIGQQYQKTYDVLAKPYVVIQPGQLRGTNR